MKAILLAAGVGRRISRSISTPKSLLKVGDSTILGNTVKMLLKNNIEVAVVVGYMKNQLQSELEGLPITFYYNPFYYITNSCSSLWFAKDFIDSESDIILANADVFWEQSVLDTLLADERDIVMLADTSRTEIGDYFFQTKDGIVVRNGINIPVEDRTCEYAGIAKIKKTHIPYFKKKLDDFVEGLKYNSWWENILYENKDVHPIHIRDISQHFWSEVDFIEDYTRIQNYLNTNNN